MRALVFTFVCWTMFFVPSAFAQTSPPAPGGGEAVARLARTQRAALAHSPGLRAEQAGLTADAASFRREAASGSPYLEWQSEGLNGSGRATNATDYLRLGTPFNLPGQIGRARSLVRIADGWVVTALDVASYATVAEASRRWLALAAAVEREQLSAARLLRLDNALALQEARYQLGEIAGTEVRQLDLEHVSETSRLATLRSDVAAAEAAVRELCGDIRRGVRSGDLEVVAAASRTPDQAGISDEGLAGGPALRRAAGDAELARGAADLARSTAWGRAEIEAEWERVPAVDGLPSFNAWGFRIAVPLPIGAAGHRQREEARARADHADASLEVASRGVMRAAEEALAVAEGAAARLRALEPALLDLPDIDHSLSEQFRLGAISYLAYIDGLSRLDRVVEEAIDARSALLGARLDLAVLLGDTTIFPLVVSSVDEED